MNQLLAQMERFRSVRPDMKVMASPLLILMILAMMVVPMAPFMLDILFSFNIALALIVIFVSLFTRSPLDFSSFPSILLFTTLLRLSLNVASTRVVLMEGHTGSDAAGQVIESFGNYLVGGNFAVGIAIFAIFIVINFMVITKGAGRIAEVGARFTLDAMPGKQMAIDADLNAGLINEDEARKRRKEVSQEADFYGSMDGSSKFVRGDAIAGIVIMFVNIFGGLFIGVLQHGMSFSDAATTYTMLTIGDGLVAQIPALIISMAAGIIVSRVNTAEDVGQQMMGQMFANPVVLYLAGGVIGLLGLLPGMPHFSFLLFGSVLGFLGWKISQSQDEKILQGIDSVGSAAHAATQEKPEATWSDVHLVETLALEVGHRLIPMVDNKQDGSLLTRIKNVRKKFAQGMGFLPASIHIRDSLDLGANQYSVSLKGVEIGTSSLYPDKWLAINPGGVTGNLTGVKTIDPAFGLDAIWIDASSCDRAQAYGYTVVDAATVAATHLSNLMQRHAMTLLGSSETRELLDKVSSEDKQLVEDVVPKLIPMTMLQRILRELLSEEVSIRDMRTILELLAEHAEPSNGDWRLLVDVIRIGLGRAITHQWFGSSPELNVIGLDFQLETIIMSSVQSGGALEPNISRSVMEQAEAAVRSQQSAGYPPVLIVNHPLRNVISSFLRKKIRHIAVLSLSEIPDDRSIKVTSTIGGNGI